MFKLNKRIKPVMIIFIIIILLAGGISVFADPSKPEGFTIQDAAPKFIPGGKISDSHWTNVPFYAYVFITNKFNSINVIVTYDVTVTGTLQGKDLNNNTVTLPVSLTIPANQSYGSVALTLPYQGDWTMTISGSLMQRNGKWDSYIGSIVIPITNPPQGMFLQVIPGNTEINAGATCQYSATLVYDKTNLDMTSFAKWTTSNPEIATVGTSGKCTPGLVTGISPGSATVTASLANTAFSGSGEVLVGIIDHLVVVDSSGSPADPVLQLRPDFPREGQAWGYIGENMIISVYLQAFSSSGQAVSNYQWDTSRFNNYSVWNLSLTAANGNPVPSRILVSPLANQIMVSGVPTLQALLTVILQKDPKLMEQEYVNNFTITLNPADADGVHLISPASAKVEGNNGPYNMYGGRIRVANGYYYQPAACATVFVERYQQEGFVTNANDSLTLNDSQTHWKLMKDLVVKQVINNTTGFNLGKGQVSITNNISNAGYILTPAGYPAYLGVVTGTQTWGQIVPNPPASEGGPLWEYEILPQ
jgi:hypothetical protein